MGTKALCQRLAPGCREYTQLALVLLPWEPKPCVRGWSLAVENITELALVLLNTLRTVMTREEPRWCKKPFNLFRILSVSLLPYNPNFYTPMVPIFSPNYS